LVFHISSDPTPNAFATIGGHIYINRGLIALLDRSEDLLGVVAHEIIHVQKRHVAKSVVQALGLYGLLAIFVGDFTGIGAVLIDQGGSMLSLSYSRDLEEEADRKAIELLVHSEIDPVGLANSLILISGEQKKLISQNPAGEVLEKLQKIELLSSHPEVENRVKDIKTYSNELLKDKSLKAIEFDYEKFKISVKEYF
jgi:beta-barrel assembly-enhancing protease